MIKNKLLTFVFFGLAWFMAGGFVMASGFSIAVDVSYELNDLNEVVVVETRKVGNTTPDQVISNTNKEIFTITDITKNAGNLKKTVDTIILTVNDRKADFSVSYGDDSAKITVQYPGEVRQNQTMTFRLSYKSYGMIRKSGAVYDFFAPGLVKETQEKKDTSFTYTASLKLKNSLPKINFVAPSSESNSVSGDYSVYVFKQEMLTNNNIWVQFGTVQYYKFSYKMDAKATDDRNLGLINTYKIVVPRDVEGAKVYQHVFFRSVKPEPDQAELDEEGNLYLLFSEGSNKELKIEIDGYIELGEKGVTIGADNSGDIGSYDAGNVAANLQPAEYWEVNNDKIKQLAGELKTNNSNTYEIILKTYEYLVSKINYNTVKKFGLNPRQGALTTLENGSGVCMEYSDLFITLSRAQGIPARAAFGYGYDPLEPESLKEPHQWAEVLVPGQENWVSADITWGLSGKILIGGDLNHIYTHVTGKGPEEIANISRVSYGENQVLDLPAISFEPMEQPETNVDYRTQSEMTEKYKNPKNQNFFEMAIYKIGLVANNFEDVDIISKLLIIAGISFVFIPLMMLAFKPVANLLKKSRKHSKR